MMRMSAAAVIAAALSAAAVLATVSPSAAREPQNNQAAGWGAMDCNGHTHVVWGPTWIAPNHRMQDIFIQDRDHDNFTPLKLTVNSVTITNPGCGSPSDASFSTTPEQQTVGGVVSNAVQVRASMCHGPRTYDINITCEHDGMCGDGVTVCPAIESHDLMVTVGGKRPAPEVPFVPKPE